MGWSSDLEPGGRGFDSRLPEGRFGIILGSLFRQFWDVSGNGLGTFSDGFGMVSQKNVGWGRKVKVFKNDRQYFF